jgi:CubicO group peptidase (beta-lactamase class C family)
MCFLHSGHSIGILGGNPGTVTPTASCTKSLIAMAVFKLVGEHKLNIDQPLYQILTGPGYERWQHFAEGDFRNITPRHLLTHTSGFPGNDWFLPKDESRFIPGDYQFNNHLAGSYDRNQRAAIHPLLYKVGPTFDYSNPATQILGAVIKKALCDSGDSRTVTAFIKNEILLPLQMNHTSLNEEDGITMCNGGMDSTALDLAKLAECVRQDGRWNGHQIIAKAAVQEMLLTPRNIVGVNPKCAHLWLKLDDYGFAANGDLNNCAIILPDDEIVIARTQPLPPGPIYRETEGGSKEFTDSAKEAGTKASKFWRELVSNENSILREFRKSRP